MRRFFVTRWHDQVRSWESDVSAFDRRSGHYDDGFRGSVHRRIVDVTLDIVLREVAPKSILDVGCGTGYLLRQAAGRCPGVVVLAGLDPSPGMVELARSGAKDDPRLVFTMGIADNLPFLDDTFDLILSITSFDYWADQRAAARECHRVIAPGGRLVITDLFSNLLIPTVLINRPDRARTLRKAKTLLTDAGFTDMTWQEVTGVATMANVILRCVMASKSADNPELSQTGHH